MGKCLVRISSVPISPRSPQARRRSSNNPFEIIIFIDFCAEAAALSTEKVANSDVLGAFTLRFFSPYRASSSTFSDFIFIYVFLGSSESGEGLDEVENLSDLERVKSWLASDLLLHRCVAPRRRHFPGVVITHFLFSLYLARDLAEFARRLGAQDALSVLVPGVETLANEDEISLQQVIFYCFLLSGESFLDEFGRETHGGCALLPRLRIFFILLCCTLFRYLILHCVRNVL